MEIVADGAMKRGDRLYVPVRPKGQPPTMFSFMHAVAGAEVELRDEGLDIILTPEYRQKYVVVARIAGEPAPFIYFSQDEAQLGDLARLLGRDLAGATGSVTFEDYPFDGPEDQDVAWREALNEHPTAKILK